MKNRYKTKKLFIGIGIVTIIFLILFIIINQVTYRLYVRNYNIKLSHIISNVIDANPNISKSEIINYLDDDNINNYLKDYGFDYNSDSFIKINNTLNVQVLGINIGLLVLYIVGIILLIVITDHKRSREIDNIIKLLEQINQKNYSLDINSISEDELSILKNELYKMTIMLKEDADLSRREKLELKKSLEDISHQLKTPLTSSLIMLDNIIEDDNMPLEVRNEFLKDIKREISNMSFLIQNILKLSKFNTNTIKYNYSDELISMIVKESIKNVSVLCDLKNINLNVLINSDSKIHCDLRWEVEAISNLLKNAIEHSFENNKVDIIINDSKVYSELTIKDYGSGISREDMKHIFERFYQSSNVYKDSIGIGLALAKSIINNDNGIITVDSDENGTTFVIKYYK